MRCGVAKTARKGREIGGYIAQIDMKIFDPPTPISRKNSFNSSAEGRYGSPTSMQTCSRWSTEQRPLLSGYVFRRDSAAATGASMARLTGNMFVFANFVDLENRHPKFALEFVSKYASMSYICSGGGHRINTDPQRLRYMDQALTPVSEGETQSLELFTHTDDARHAVEHARKVAHLTGGERLTAGEQPG